jgi:NADH dehydrogenase FAD-containing subunit
MGADCSANSVQGTSLARSLGVEHDRGSRVHVLPDLSIQGAADVFAAGDIVYRELKPAVRPRAASWRPSTRRLGRPSTTATKD